MLFSILSQAALRGGLWRVWGRGGGECRVVAGVGWAGFRGLRGRWWQGGQCGGALHRDGRDTTPPPLIKAHIAARIKVQ
jgi:hypothetical protein